MATQNDNPFVLPGFGHSGDMAENPLVASMEMMRQAWQGLAGAGRLDQASMGVPLSLEELDRRITDLKAVENWLRMNLSMLSSTIQALEVQRAMVATLKSFVAGAASKSSDGRSPLEVVLGIHPGGGMDQSKAAWPEPPASAGTAKASSGAAGERASAASGNDAPAKDQPADKGAPDAPTAPDAYAAQAAAAAQGWWDMVQKQFDSLAAATAATLQAADIAKAAQGQAASGVSADSSLGKGDTKGLAAKSAQKTAASGGAARKTAKKAAAPASRRGAAARKP